MPTANFYIGVDDGWVELSSATDFVRVSGHPHSHPFYVYAGASAPSLTAAAATGEVIFSGLPAEDDTVTIGSETYTFKVETFGEGTVTFTGLPTADDTVDIGSETYVFKALAAVPFEVTIGADADETGDNLVTAITADSTLVTGSNLAGVVTVTAILPGDVGNYVLAEDADNTAVDGMVGGTDLPGDPFDVTVGTDATTTGDNFEATVLADSTLVTANNAAGTVTLTAIAVGEQGNYALSEDADNTTVSGAAMTGGAEAVIGVLTCHHPFEVNVTMTEKLFARLPVPVANADKNNGKIRLDVFTIV